MESIKPEFSGMFTREALEINTAQETERIVKMLKQAVHQKLHRQGAVVGISGGIDSSVVLALCARAFGSERVFALMMPEKDSSSESEMLARSVAGRFGVQTDLENITPVLDGFGCYRRRDEALSRLFPDFESNWRVKITIPGNLLDQDMLTIYHVTVVSPDGRSQSCRLPLREFYQVVAASNFKQRTRMSMLYYHAELRNFAVIGTANKNEHELGFFVKYGDGGADAQPIAHLFKTQVFQMADHLDVPEQVRRRTPTTDTYSAGSSQEEFFFRVPFDILDPVWFGHERGIPPAEIGAAIGLTADQVGRVIGDILRKQHTAAYLRSAPVAVA
jgi:NAD+ synthase